MACSAPRRLQSRGLPARAPRRPPMTSPHQRHLLHRLSLTPRQNKRLPSIVCIHHLPHPVAPPGKTLPSQSARGAQVRQQRVRVVSVKRDRNRLRTSLPLKATERSRCALMLITKRGNIRKITKSRKRRETRRIAKLTGREANRVIVGMPPPRSPRCGARYQTLRLQY